MEIAELKHRIDIYELAERLGIKVNRYHKALCPFHNDKTPSLQFNREKQLATCFSSNCDAGSMDVIDLTKKKLNLDTGEAIRWLQEEYQLMTDLTKSKPTKDQKPPYKKFYQVFRSSMVKSKKAKEYLESRGLDYKELEVGYNASYWPQMQQCIIFPLKNKKGDIVSFYGRSTYHLAENKHYYTKERQGLYPGYPLQETTTLILTESIIDAATLQTALPDTQTLALYGTNGLTEEHKESIRDLKKLKEIILFFDGDEAGRKATLKVAKELSGITNCKLSVVDCPEGEDINSLAVSHEGEEQELFNHLIENRRSFFFSPEEETGPSQEKEKTPQQIITSTPQQHLDTSHPYHLRYITKTAIYAIKGGLGKQGLDSLKVTIEIKDISTKRKYRNKADLYEYKQVERISREASEQLNLRADLVELDLSDLTDQLEIYREKELEVREQTKLQATELTHQRYQQCKDFLSKPNVIERLNELIGKAGVIGEETARIFLFGIATSYKMPDTLHGLIQGSSGSGKTHLLTRISNFIPGEDRKHFTRVTEGSFYNYGMYDLKNKLICLEDLDGMKEEAYLAFRELQSRGMISSSTSGKDEQGNIKAMEKVVYGPIASLSCTTKGTIYEDNMNRCFLIAVDESKRQTHKIIEYQNKVSAGEIDKEQERQVTEFIRDCIRILKPYEVVNPYAGKVNLPEEAHKLRRLNDLYQSYVKQVTILNQYRRTRSHGKLVSEKEDLQTAAGIMFDSIVLKVDELDGSLRDFYERLKDYVKSKGDYYDQYSFGQREVRQSLHVSKTQLQRYINDLTELEYIRQTGGYANRGYQYKITYWDNIEVLRSRVKRHLQGQLDQLEIYREKALSKPAALATHDVGSPDGSPERVKNPSYVS